MQKSLDHKMVVKAQSNSKEPYFGMKCLLKDMYGLNLHNSKKGTFRFRVYLSEKLKDMPIENLELSERGRNCLRRAGFNNLYELYDAVNGKNDLLAIRNCGNGTAKEVMEKIFIYQFNSFSEEKKKKYIDLLVELNA